MHQAWCNSFTVKTIYASRALTQTEQQYGQIEKELLAVVFGIERFNKYTYGRKVLVKCDHKALKIIHKKLLTSAQKHLQHMLLRLKKCYSTYKSGRQIHVGDVLLRAYKRD